MESIENPVFISLQLYDFYNELRLRSSINNLDLPFGSTNWHGCGTTLGQNAFCESILTHFACDGWL